MKALVISVGTGVGSQGVQSLAGGIAFSIRQNNADKVFFVTSSESAEQTLPKVLELTCLASNCYEEIMLPDTEDINRIYQQLAAKFREIRDDFEYLTVDYTSGTKAMTGALAILGSLYEADTLSYVSGEREGGVVVKGTERLLSVSPYNVLGGRKLAEAVAFFNHCQFDTCLGIIDHLERKIALRALPPSLALVKKAALAYSLWDKFNHQEAYTHLWDIKQSDFDCNKSFLGRLLSYPEKEPYHIADLLNNASRRGDIEQKYDDAVARLYRTTELIAQFRLKDHGIENTSNVPREKVPPELSERIRPVDGKIKVGLRDAYEILAQKGDEVGGKFMNDMRLNDLLQKRNSSILAHGLAPVGRDVYHELREKVFSLASSAVNGLSGLLSDSKFVTLSLSR